MANVFIIASLSHWIQRTVLKLHKPKGRERSELADIEPYSIRDTTALRRHSLGGRLELARFSMKRRPENVSPDPPIPDTARHRSSTTGRSPVPHSTPPPPPSGSSPPP